MMDKNGDGFISVKEVEKVTCAVSVYISYLYDNDMSIYRYQCHSMIRKYRTIHSFCNCHKE